MPRTARRPRSTPWRAAAPAWCICPSTEGNLGDGLADLPGWLNAGVPMSIGSDSHVTRAWPEELRWLEYGQRLLHRQRNVSAAPDQGEAGHRGAAVRARAARRRRAPRASHAWGLTVGARADLLVLDTQDDALLGVPAERLLDALVFSSPGRPFRDVMVAGRWVRRSAGTAARFADAMHALWQDA